MPADTTLVHVPYIFHKKIVGYLWGLKVFDKFFHARTVSICQYYMESPWECNNPGDEKCMLVIRVSL